MATLTSMHGRLGSERNLVWCVPKPRNLDKVPSFFGEIAIAKSFLFYFFLGHNTVLVVAKCNDANPSRSPLANAYSSLSSPSVIRRDALQHRSMWRSPLLITLDAATCNPQQDTAPPPTTLEQR